MCIYCIALIVWKHMYRFRLKLNIKYYRRPANSYIRIRNTAYSGFTCK